MILEFSVGNFLSFKKRVTLSFVASADRAHPGSLIPVPGPAGLAVVKSLAVYGANASGKSNLVRALTFMEGFVRTSADERQDRELIAVTPFRLDPATEHKPSEFEIAISLGEERYVYGFTVDSERVHEEWLTASRKRPRLLFRRHPDGSVEFGNSWRGDREQIANLARERAKSLLLTLAAQAGNPTTLPVYRWFVLTLRPVRGSAWWRTEATSTTKMLAEDPQALSSVMAFLQAADVGIRSLALRPMSVAQSDPEAHSIPAKGLVRTASDGSPDAVITLDALHRRTDGEDVAFSFDQEESDGTKRLYALASDWMRAFERGRVVVIDELHAQLHPLISRFLIEAFHRHAGQAQIVFTTHDCTLLDPDLLRRDQIWFTEKDSAGATDLYSLWDYRPRRDANFRGGYLKGRYGAIPFVGEFQF